MFSSCGSLREIFDSLFRRGFYKPYWLLIVLSSKGYNVRFIVQVEK